MGIVPISGIPILPGRSEGAESDLSGVFRVEFQREQQDSYSPHGEGADRGLEEEQGEPTTQDEADEPAELQTAADSGGSEKQISFFA